MKRVLSVKTKLSLCILLVSISCSLIVGVFSYVNSKSNLIKYMGLRAKDIAQAVSVHIDGDKVAQYDKTKETDDYYEELLHYLDKVKKSIDITYLYIMTDSGNDYKYIVEAQSDENASQLGDVDSKDQYGQEPAEVLSTGTATYSSIQSSSGYGDMLSGFAPITDSLGNIVAVVGIDISADIINQSLAQYIPITLGIMVLSCILSFILISISINKLIIKPIGILEAVSKEMANSKLNIEIPSIYLDKKDEIGSLFNAFSIVAEHINLIISDISFVLGEMSYKNLAVGIDREYTGDFQPIKKSLENILDSYNRLLYSYDAVTQQISSSSQRLSDISGELAQGSMKQSRAVDKLSTTVQLISNHANKNSQNTSTAKDYVCNMRNNIDISNEQMREMLFAIDEISAASSHISKIINVIDGITFQTNILALNASIEAARAGNTGKGFTVIADEVRNLALKTTEAANETSALITASINAVNKGTHLAKQTAKALENVLSKVTLVNNIIDEIEKDTAEQAKALSDIILQINVISEVLQDNSSQSKESAASSEELTAQAKRLYLSISEFKLKEDNCLYSCHSN